MPSMFGRREFLGATAGAAMGLAARSAPPVREPREGPIRVGIIGAGNRGRSLLSVLLNMKGVIIPAVCDINVDAAQRSCAMVSESGRPEPETYTRDETVYREMLERDDLDAVIIATYWQWHAPMAVDAMKAGKYAGVEVPAAISLDECWDLVNTCEAAKVPCMMLENWSFRRDNLAVLNMIRAGLFGEIVHCHCAHSHDCIDHWFFDPQGNMRWGGEFLVNHNRDQYPTHSQGPVLSWLDINCGDAYATVASAATASKGINAYFERRFGSDHPNAKRQYRQGDIVTSVVRTHRGRTVVINYDMQLPRPYDNRWMVEGVLGLYDEGKNAVYVEGRSPAYHEWEPFGPYQEEFDHPWWRELRAEAADAGHSGTDYLEMRLFLEAVRAGTETPLDVYDSVTMSSIIPLSEKSIEGGGVPVSCPDFTRGQWKRRKPTFAVTA